jgi:flagellar hook-length control protein FliK
MNATPPVSQSQPSNDAIQPNAPASAGPQAAHANSRDFAGALNDAGGQPARKNTAGKPHGADSSGGQLPPPGNQAPLAATPPPTQANNAGVAAPGTPGAAANVQPKTPDSTPPPAVAKAAVAMPPAASLVALGLTQDVHGSQALNAPGMPPGSSMTPMLGAAGAPAAAAVSTVLSGRAAGASAATARVPAASAAAAPAAKPIDATASKASIAAATSVPTSADGNPGAQSGTTPNAAPPSANTDAAAQAVMAAAIAQGTSAPTTHSSPPADDMTTPDTGAAPQGVPGSSAAPAAAIAAAATHAAASMTAAVRAATALSIAQAVSAAAGAGAADKHSRGGPDSSLSGTSSDGTAGAAQLLPSSAATDASPPPTLKVAAGVDTAEFGQGVADRVSLMVDSNLTSAKLQVNPPALGPIEVRIALQGGHAQVWFTSHSALTRDALESSSPQLREMLGAQGFGQVSVDISQRSFQERSPQSHGYEGTPAIRGESSDSVQASGATSRAASGLLDAYA